MHVTRVLSCFQLNLKLFQLSASQVFRRCARE